MRNGTRPDGESWKPGIPWTIKRFADKVGTTPATVRAWRSGARRPRDTIQVENELFGSNDAYDRDRNKLRKEHEAAGRCPGSVGEPDSVTRDENASVAIGAVLPRIIDCGDGKVGLSFGPLTGISGTLGEFYGVNYTRDQIRSSLGAFSFSRVAVPRGDPRREIG
jgi:hypothetical protein